MVINGKKGGKFDNLACSGTKDNMTCTEGEISTSRKCTTTDTLVNNLKFVDGQYTYTYNGSTGWSVVLTDKTSTDPVTTELCGTINDKPIVSMNQMFFGSKAISIDLSSFDTSKVTNMESMFYGSKATSIDVSSFDTSNVTNMYQMFYQSAATEIKGLETFNTSKVTSMKGMFYSTEVTSLDLSSFDTSNVADMSNMFMESATTILDLSSFDTSKVTDMRWMFLGSKATTGYARTQEDADRFNASSSKPSGLTFVVKS